MHENRNNADSVWQRCCVASKGSRVFCICLVSFWWPHWRLFYVVYSKLVPTTSIKHIKRTDDWCYEFMLGTPLRPWKFLLGNCRFEKGCGRLYNFWLVVWLPFFIFPYIGNVLIPIDELVFFRGVAQPPTRFVHWTPGDVHVFIRNLAKGRVLLYGRSIFFVVCIPTTIVVNPF